MSNNYVSFILSFDDMKIKVRDHETFLHQATNDFLINYYMKHSNHGLASFDITDTHQTTKSITDIFSETVESKAGLSQNSPTDIQSYLGHENDLAFIKKTTSIPDLDRNSFRYETIDVNSTPCTFYFEQTSSEHMSSEFLDLLANSIFSNTAHDQDTKVLFISNYAKIIPCLFDIIYSILRSVHLNHETQNNSTPIVYLFSILNTKDNYLKNAQSIQIPTDVVRDNNGCELLTILRLTSFIYYYFTVLTYQDQLELLTNAITITTIDDCNTISNIHPQITNIDDIAEKQRQYKAPSSSVTQNITNSLQYYQNNIAKCMILSMIYEYKDCRLTTDISSPKSWLQQKSTINNIHHICRLLIDTGQFPKQNNNSKLSGYNPQRPLSILGRNKLLNILQSIVFGGNTSMERKASPTRIFHIIETSSRLSRTSTDAANFCLLTVNHMLTQMQKDIRGEYRIGEDGEIETTGRSRRDVGKDDEDAIKIHHISQTLLNIRQNSCNSEVEDEGEGKCKGYNLFMQLFHLFQCLSIDFCQSFSQLQHISLLNFPSYTISQINPTYKYGE